MHHMFSPFGHRDMHFGCCGFGLLRLILVALGIKWLVDQTQRNRQASDYPPYTGPQNYQPPQAANPPAPQADRSTAKLNEETDQNASPWIDKVE